MRKKLLMIGVLLVFAFALTGCVNLDVAVNIDKDGNGTERVVAAIDKALIEDGTYEEEEFYTTAEELQICREAGIRIERTSYTLDDVNYVGEITEFAFEGLEEGIDKEVLFGFDMAEMSILCNMFVEQADGQYYLNLDMESMMETIDEESEGQALQGYTQKMMQEMFKFRYAVKVDGNLVSNNANKVEKDGTLVWNGFTPLNAKWKINEKQAEALLKSNFPLTDVPGHWAEEALRVMYGMGVMKGKTETLMKPDDTIKRAEAVAMIQRYFEFEGQKYRDVPFIDVSPSAWYHDTICWAYSTKVVDGVSETRFAPEKELTMQELLKMLYNYIEVNDISDWVGTGELVVCSDFTDASEWAKEAITFAGKSGILLVDENGRCNPKAPATRAQFAEILYRVW